MTDNKIEENAENWVSPMRKVPSCDSDTIALVKSAYIYGAHSRDEEISRLGYINGLNTAELVAKDAELQVLRNPWISVEEKMPPIKTRVLFLDNNGKAWLGKNTISGYAELESDQPEILPPPTVPTCKPIITHWMPIPELKKGGKK